MSLDEQQQRMLSSQLNIETFMNSKLAQGLTERALNDMNLARQREDLIIETEKDIAAKRRQRLTDYSPPSVSDMDGAYEKLDDTHDNLVMAAKSYADNLAQEREAVANQVYLLNESHRRWRAERKKRFIDEMKSQYYGPGRGIGRGVQLLRLRPEVPPL
jgi:hypothetical protein